MLESKIYLHLSTVATVIGQVGTRIYPGHLPEDAAFPSVCYERLNTDRVYSLSGYATLERADMSLSCWAETVQKAREVADLVHTAMQSDAVTFRAVLLSDNNEVEILPDENIRYRTVLNFSIWNRE